MDSLSTMIEANFEYMRKIGERKAESGHLYSTMPIEFFLSYPTLSKFMFFKWGHYFIGTEEFDNFSEWNIPVGLLLPKVMPNCMYRNPSSFAIDPSGDMFKCLEYLGNSQYKVGNIREKSFLCLKWLVPFLLLTRLMIRSVWHVMFFLYVVVVALLIDKRKKEGIKIDHCSAYKTMLADMLPIYYKCLES